MSQLFNVMLERKIGGFVMLEHRGRTSWTKRTATKHAKDMLKGDVYLSVGITPSDFSTPVIPII